MHMCSFFVIYGVEYVCVVLVCVGGVAVVYVTKLHDVGKCIYYFVCGYCVVYAVVYLQKWCP